MGWGDYLSEDNEGSVKGFKFVRYGTKYEQNNDDRAGGGLDV
jgi:hypothetical protein